LEDKTTNVIHFCKNGFVPGYEVWKFHGESGYEVWKFHNESGTRVVAKDEHDCDVGNIDRIDKMLEAIQVKVTEDPPIVEVEVFFKLLKASQELLH
jgi:hypothetical protein